MDHPGSYFDYAGCERPIDTKHVLRHLIQEGLELLQDLEPDSVLAPQGPFLTPFTIPRSFRVDAEEIVKQQIVIRESRQPLRVPLRGTVADVYRSAASFAIMKGQY